MIPTDIKKNQSAKTPSKLEVFKSPWQKGGLGTKIRLYLLRNPNDSSVRAQIATRNLFNQFTNVLKKKFQDKPITHDKKNKIVEEKKFSNITEERFQNEKEEIQKLVDQHASVKRMLEMVEKDFSIPPTTPLPSTSPLLPTQSDAHSKGDQQDTSDEMDDFLFDMDFNDEAPQTHEEEKSLPEPTLTPEEIEERKTTVQELHNKLEELMKEIKEQEKNPELKSYERLKTSIEKIKKKALSTFSKISELEQDAVNPAVSSTKLLEDAKEIENSNLKWNQDIAAIRKTLVEEASLQNEIDALSIHIKAFSKNMQNKWEELVMKWKIHSIPEISSTAEVDEERNLIFKTIHSFCKQCKEELMETIETAIESLQENLNASPPVFPEKNRQKAHLDFRRQALEVRNEAWNSLRETTDISGTDLKVLADLQRNILAEKSFDESLIELLTLPDSDKSFLGKIYSTLPSFPSLFGRTPPPLLIKEKEAFDEAAYFYVHHTLRKIKETATRFLELFSPTQTEINSLSQKLQALFSDRSLLHSTLNSFIDELISFSQKNRPAEQNELGQKVTKKFSLLLQRQKEALSVIMAAQERDKNPFIEKAKIAYPKAFSQETHLSILTAAQTALNQILKNQTSEIDLQTLTGVWQKNRNTALTVIETLHQLETLAMIQKEYETIAENREKEIENLTGEEKNSGKKALAQLNQAIKFLETLTKKSLLSPSDSASYREKLLKANASFNPLFEIEAQKKTLHESLDKEINAFLMIIKASEKQIAEMEKTLSIQMVDTKETLNKKRNKIEEWRQKGTVSNSWLNWTSKSVDIDNLRLNELPHYIEALKSEIAAEKKSLDSLFITKAHEALKTFQQESKNLDTHIKSLISVVQPTKKGQDGFEFQIPSQLSSAHLPKLQLQNATVANERQKKVLAEHKNAIKSSSNPQKIFHRLTEDAETLKRIVTISKKTPSLPLLDQVDNLSAFPAQQNAAKLAFFEILTTKMATHTEKMTEKVKEFKEFPKLFHDAERIIANTKFHLTKNLGEMAHKTIQAHAERWYTIKHSKTPASHELISTKELTDIASLSISQLRRYESLVNLAIKNGKDLIAMIEKTYDKTSEASRQFNTKVKLAEKRIKELNKNNQVIAKNRLQKVLESIKNDKKLFSEEKNESEKELFHQVTEFFNPSKNIRALDSTLHLLDEYRKKLGDAISKIEAVLREIDKKGDLSIPQQLQQLALNPDLKTAEDLRNRFLEEHKEKISEEREKFEEYKQDLFTAYSHYIPKESRLYREIERAVDDKLTILNNYEEKHHSESFFSLIKSDTPVSKLDPQQMEIYSQRLEKIQKTLQDSLNDKYFVDEITIAQVQYERKKKEALTKHAEKLRGNNQFLDAALFVKEIRRITRIEETKWQQKVTDVSQIKGLITALKNYTREIDEAIEEYEIKKTPSCLEEQMSGFLDLRKEESKTTWFGKPQTDKNTIERLDAEIKELKNKMISDVEDDQSEHRNILKKIKNDIEEIYSIYHINVITKYEILKCLNKELVKFTENRGKYSTPYLWVLSSQKTIEEMSPQEIVKIKPGQTSGDSIFESIKNINDVFDYKRITEPYAAYKEALKKAETFATTLEKKNQFVLAQKLNKEIEEIKKEHKEQCIEAKVKWGFLSKGTADIRTISTLQLDEKGKAIKIAINDDEGLSQLISNLEGFTTRLQIQIAESEIKATSSDSILDQEEEIAADPSYKQKMAPILVKEIEKIASKHRTTAQDYIKETDKLVKHFGFPKPWQKAITKDLEDCQTRIKAAGSGLAVKTQAWLSSGTKKHSLWELSFDQLREVRINIEKEEVALNIVIGKYHLNKLKSELEYFEKQKTNIQKLKTKWTNESQFPSVKKLEKLLDQTKEKLTSQFEIELNQQLNTQDLPKSINNSFDYIDEIVTEMMKEIDKIEKEKPKTIGYLLQHTTEGSEEYLKLRKVLENDIKAKVEKEKIHVKEYSQKIDKIHKKILEISKGETGIPGPWRKKVEDLIIEKQTQLIECLNGLPIIAPNKEVLKGLAPKEQEQVNLTGFYWKPFSKLSKTELLEYETLINTIVAKEGVAENLSTSMKRELENQIKLHEIEKYTANFKVTLELLETFIHKAGSSNENAIKAEAIIEFNKERVFKAFENLTLPEDAKLLSSTLFEAQASFLSTRKPLTNNEPIHPSPWENLYYSEQKKEPPDSFDSEKIRDRGFNIDFYPNDKSVFGTSDSISWTVESLQNTISLYIDEFKNKKNTINKNIKLLDTRLKQNHYISYLTNHFDQFLKLEEELIEIKKGLPKTVENEFIRNSEIKKLQDLIKYKKLIHSTINKCNSIENKIKNNNAYYWYTRKESVKDPQKDISDEEISLESKILEEFFSQDNDEFDTFFTQNNENSELNQDDIDEVIDFSQIDENGKDDIIEIIKPNQSKDSTSILSALSSTTIEENDKDDKVEIIKPNQSIDNNSIILSKKSIVQLIKETYLSIEKMEKTVDTETNINALTRDMLKRFTSINKRNKELAQSYKEYNKCFNILFIKLKNNGFKYTNEQDKELFAKFISKKFDRISEHVDIIFKDSKVQTRFNNSLTLIQNNFIKLSEKILSQSISFDESLDSISIDNQKIFLKKYLTSFKDRKKEIALFLEDLKDFFNTFLIWANKSTDKELNSRINLCLDTLDKINNILESSIYLDSKNKIKVINLINENIINKTKNYINNEENKKKEVLQKNITLSTSKTINQVVENSYDPSSSSNDKNEKSIFELIENIGPLKIEEELSQSAKASIEHYNKTIQSLFIKFDESFIPEEIKELLIKYQSLIKDKLTNSHFKFVSKSSDPIKISAITKEFKSMAGLTYRILEESHKFIIFGIMNNSPRETTNVIHLLNKTVSYIQNLNDVTDLKNKIEKLSRLCKQFDLIQSSDSKEKFTSSELKKTSKEIKISLKNPIKKDNNKNLKEEFKRKLSFIENVHNIKLDSLSTLFYSKMEKIHKNYDFDFIPTNQPQTLTYDKIVLYLNSFLHKVDFESAFRATQEFKIELEKTTTELEKSVYSNTLKEIITNIKDNIKNVAKKIGQSGNLNALVKTINHSTEILKYAVQEFNNFEPLTDLSLQIEQISENDPKYVLTTMKVKENIKKRSNTIKTNFKEIHNIINKLNNTLNTKLKEQLDKKLKSILILAKGYLTPLIYRGFIQRTGTINELNKSELLKHENENIEFFSENNKQLNALKKSLFSCLEFTEIFEEAQNKLILLKKTFPNALFAKDKFTKYVELGKEMFTNFSINTNSIDALDRFVKNSYSLLQILKEVSTDFERLSKLNSLEQLEEEPDILTKDSEQAILKKIKKHAEPISKNTLQVIEEFSNSIDEAVTLPDELKNFMKKIINNKKEEFSLIYNTDLKQLNTSEIKKWISNIKNYSDKINLELNGILDLHNYQKKYKHYNILLGILNNKSNKEDNKKTKEKIVSLNKNLLNSLKENSFKDYSKKFDSLINELEVLTKEIDNMNVTNQNQNISEFINQRIQELERYSTLINSSNFPPRLKTMMLKIVDEGSEKLSEIKNINLNMDELNSKAHIRKIQNHFLTNLNWDKRDTLWKNHIDISKKSKEWILKLIKGKNFDLAKELKEKLSLYESEYNNIIKELVSINGFWMRLESISRDLNETLNLVKMTHKNIEEKDSINNKNETMKTESESNYNHEEYNNRTKFNEYIFYKESFFKLQELFNNISKTNFSLEQANGKGEKVKSIIESISIFIENLLKKSIKDDEFKITISTISLIVEKFHIILYNFNELLNNLSKIKTSNNKFIYGVRTKIHDGIFNRIFHSEIPNLINVFAGFTEIVTENEIIGIEKKLETFISAIKDYNELLENRRFEEFLKYDF